MKGSALFILCLTATVGQAQTADTLYTKRDLFTASDAVLGAAFMVGTAAAAPADRWFTRQLQDDARQANRALNRGASVFRIVGHPGGMIAGGTMYLAGLAGNNRRIEDLGLHYVESILLAHVINIS